MSLCPKCNKPVYFVECVKFDKNDWHKSCLRCEKCNKTLVAGKLSDHEGKPYCNIPCYQALFGPQGCGRGALGAYPYNNTV